MADLSARVADAIMQDIKLTDFYAHLPDHRYIYIPTRELWPAASVDGRVTDWPINAETGKPMRPSAYLDAERAVVQMTWCPGEPMLVEGRVVSGGGWIRQGGARVFNLYREPPMHVGDPTAAGPWLDHLRRVYPADAEHIERWLAHRVQLPGEKINHALVLGGDQGIGKDTLLEPVKHAVGHWNWNDISPAQMLGRFNGWAKSVIVRVSEARDLGDVDRFAFYDHSKTFIAAPPDTIRVDEKHLREHAVMNVMGVIITTNHRTDGIYLPPDDRRHYVAWSDAAKEDFAEDYWQRLWGWYGRGGIGHVTAYLRTLDLSGFDPKAPPPRTPAFHAIVDASRAPEDSELVDVIEHAGNPAVVTLEAVIGNARAMRLDDLANDLADRKGRRSVPHKLDRAGYVVVRNPDATDGLWRVGGRRVAVYGSKLLSIAEQVRAARGLA
jgi:hypothetical protein